MIKYELFLGDWQTVSQKAKCILNYEKEETPSKCQRDKCRDQNNYHDNDRNTFMWPNIYF